MTYTQARLIVQNADAYTRQQAQNAAVFILGTLDARQEDILSASVLVRRIGRPRRKLERRT